MTAVERNLTGRYYESVIVGSGADRHVAYDDRTAEFAGLKVEIERLREGGRQLDGVIRRLSDENERLRETLRSYADEAKRR